MAARGAKLKSVPIKAFTPLGSLQIELHRIQAAMWLLDQMRAGELFFLTNPVGQQFNCWASYVSFSQEQLVDHLTGMIQREVADALKDADVALRKAAGEQPERAQSETA